MRQLPVRATRTISPSDWVVKTKKAITLKVSDTTRRLLVVQVLDLTGTVTSGVHTHMTKHSNHGSGDHGATLSCGIARVLAARRLGWRRRVLGEETVWYVTSSSFRQEFRFRFLASVVCFQPFGTGRRKKRTEGSQHLGQAASRRRRRSAQG